MYLDMRSIDFWNVLICFYIFKKSDQKQKSVLMKMKNIKYVYFSLSKSKTNKDLSLHLLI